MVLSISNGVKFPDGFLWGAATAAYQVEGGNKNSDWWTWETIAKKIPSGDACRHYELFEQDFDLAKGLHHNAHRFSIEWARVEPEEGKFSDEVLNHYVAVAKALRDRGIEPIVTLHHFTNPAWFSAMGGWEHRCAAAYFLKYSERVVRALSGLVRYWITINEPTIYVSHAYLFGVWPPQAKSLLRMKRVESRMIEAHIKTYRLFHDIYKKAELPKPFVSISQHVMALVPCTKSLKNRFAVWLRHKMFNERLLDIFSRHKALDFIGINYYSRQLVELKKWGIRNLFEDVCQQGHQPLKKNSLGWDIYPEGLCDLLVRLKKYRLPIMVTENGICTQEDGLRWEFLRGHLDSVGRAIAAGVPVTGYLYWSLLDNFEWDKGFGPRFGLIEVDYATQARRIRESARKYAEVCRTGTLD
jgi:beta-glucosidase